MEDRSIHPRNWPETTSRKKKNTMGKKGQHLRAIAGLTDHCSRHPNDKVSARHLEWLSSSE